MSLPEVGSACSYTRAVWRKLMMDPAMIACAVDEHCVLAGGPSPPSCNCRPVIDGCYRAVNRISYAGLSAEGLERQFLASCPDEPRICDCAPGLTACQSGKCVIKQQFCCNCPPDAGAGQ